MSGTDQGGCECELLTSAVIGAAAFPSLLAVTQKYVFKPLRISYSPGLSSSLLGLASVTAASFGASLAALKTLTIVNQYFSPSDVRLSLNRHDLVLSTVSGVVAFRALGGRYGAVLPSNLMRPGVFAVDWIPALRESEAASPKEREVIHVLGARHGCHSCGERRGVAFVADHQPPSRFLRNHRNDANRNGATKPNPLVQRFYPQCQTCSNIQGGILGGGNGASLSHPQAIRTHTGILRPYHLFLPLPFVIAYWNEVNKSDPMHTVPQDMSTAPKTAADAEEKAGSGEVEQKPQVQAVQKAEVKKERTEADSDVWLDVEVALNFPLFIIWRRIVHFFDSFQSPLASFHMTLWAFTVVAALGTA